MQEFWIGLISFLCGGMAVISYGNRQDSWLVERCQKLERHLATANDTIECWRRLAQSRKRRRKQ